MASASALPGGAVLLSAGQLSWGAQFKPHVARSSYFLKRSRKSGFLCGISWFSERWQPIQVFFFFFYFAGLTKHMCGPPVTCGLPAHNFQNRPVGNETVVWSGLDCISTQVGKGDCFSEVQVESEQPGGLVGAREEPSEDSAESSPRPAALMPHLL